MNRYRVNAIMGGSWLDTRSARRAYKYAHQQARFARYIGFHARVHVQRIYNPMNSTTPSAMHVLPSGEVLF